MKSLEAEVLHNYTTPGHPTAYSGLNTVFEFYKGRISRKLLKEILSKRDVYTLHKHYKQRQRNPTYVHKIRYQFQIDLAHVQELSTYNDGTKYLLNCIDSFTRFAFVRPLPDKKAATFLKAFISILKQARVKPKFIVSDRGGEMVNQTFINFCRSQGIILLHNYTSTHAFIVERFNRTLKDLMYKYMTDTKQYKYIDQLQNFVESYNKRKHRMIGMSPLEAEKPKNSFKIRYRMNKERDKIKRQKVKYSIGDKVRISLEKNKFSRGHHVQSTEEIFTIYHIKTTLPIPIYYLHDSNNEKIKGGFYAFELAQVV